MAIMCPEIPKEYDIRSKEDVIFEALSRLPDDYYVFHSVALVTKTNNQITEHEIDFVVFNRNKGLICLEAKAGQVSYFNGAWRYANGELMAHDGPFRQASRFMHNLINYIKDMGSGYLLRKCKFISAVCFPSISISKISKQSLPPDSDINLILCKEQLDDIEASIDRICSLRIGAAPDQTQLSEDDVKKLLEGVLAPTFNLLPIASLEAEHRNVRFKTMLSEQIALLDYLEEQSTAVISGAAGTGKTLMAVEKARRHAGEGDKVLFLCYNTKLKEHLILSYPHPLINYYTIDGFACKMCNTCEPNYEMLQNTLVDYIDQEFPYKHIIVDECQDFGQDKLDEVKILDTLYDLIYEKDDENSTFYVFYDKNQLVQGRKLPDFISNADCKLTLYRNCRNTENIALSSMRLLGSERKPKLFERAITGSSPVIFFEPDKDKQIAAINQMIDRYVEKYDDIVILTCSTISNSVLSEYIDNNYYRHKDKKIQITTCRKFKGLEADAVILIDIDEKHVVDDLGKRLTYVGSSRARYDLALVTNLNEEEICLILDAIKKRHTKKSAKELANMFNAKYVQVEDAKAVIS